MWDEPSNPEFEWEHGRIYGEDILVFLRCPKCGRFIKAQDEVIVRGPESDAARVEFPGWECKHCGPISPAWDRQEATDERD